MSRHKFLNLSSLMWNFRRISHNAVKHGINHSKHLKSNSSVTKCVLSSMLPTIFILKALSKQDKSAHYQRVIKEADDLYANTQYEELFSYLNSHRTGDDPEILWRVARAFFEKARSVEEDKEKLSYFEEALGLVEKALQINEKCWAAHKWKAILLDYVWRYKSTKERITHSFDVKRHMERAIELNPTDGTCYYILGEWCYTFADMPWYQRKIAATLFASPPTSSFEEALQCFEKAEKVQPLFYSLNLLMIAKCHLKLNNKERASDFLKMVLEYPVVTPDDRKAQEETEKIFKDLKI